MLQNSTEGLLDVLKSQIRPHDIPQFFWSHLKKDISLIGQATGKSKDDACLILHLILRNIALRSPPKSILLKFSLIFYYFVMF